MRAPRKQLKYVCNTIVQLSITDQQIDEDFLLLVWEAAEFSDAIRNGQLLDRIKNVQSQYSSSKKITLLVCGLLRSPVDDMQLETQLTEMQLFAKINYRMIGTPADLANTVLQFTKSVAEIPYKLVACNFCTLFLNLIFA